METKTVDLKDGPRWGRLLDWIGQGYMERAVVLQEHGEPVAALLDPHAARCALAIADRLRQRKPPFTQEALDRWIAEVLAGLDVSAFMDDDSDALGPADGTAGGSQEPVAASP